MRDQAHRAGKRALQLVVIVCLAASAAEAPAADRDGAEANAGRAAELEGRLVAPCCWKQTLEVHASELATELRGEIRGRLAAGEPAAAIEHDLVSRFGERVRAVPEGRDPRLLVSAFFGVAMVASGAWLVTRGRRWVARSARPADHGAADRYGPGVYGDRLEDELREFDG